MHTFAGSIRGYRMLGKVTRRTFIRCTARATLLTVAGYGRGTPQARRPRDRERLELFTSQVGGPRISAVER